MAAGGECKLGVLAFGDSITNGWGELQWGVATHSWALWVARGIGLPYSGYATDGARVRDVVENQIPAFETVTARSDARYELGCLYIGGNDVLAEDFSSAAFERDFRLALRYLTDRCERVLTALMPHDLARSLVRERVTEANGVVERVARACGVLIVDLSAFGARNHVMVDGVHPTAFGQLAIAERALEVLARDGLAVRVRPSSLITWETTWSERLRADVAYAYRYSRDRCRSELGRALRGARARAARHLAS
jgi:lysophospholipase L1-like esterase